MYARLGLVALLGCAGVLLGCGDDEATRDTTPSTSASVATTVPTQEQLDAMLLATTDVGSDWQLGPPITDADLTDATQIPCPDTAINPTIADRLTPITGVQFEPVDRSSKHLIEFAVTGQPEQLGADLQVLFDAMDACAATTPTTIGTGSLTVKPLTIPELGDQRAGYALIGVESADATWYVRDAEVRVGSIAVEVGLTEILQTPDDEPSISDAEFVQIAQTAVGKLHDRTSELANPASEYCVERGGQVDIVDEAGGQVGYCELPDGRRVEEWAYYRSQTTTTVGDG
jgi:putative hemolysin